MTSAGRNTVMTEATAIPAFQAIARAAGQRAVHRAFQWFHLQEPKLRDWQRTLASIPAPPFGEAERAQWLAQQFFSARLQDVHIDACGNALGWILPEDRAAADGPCTLLSAHLDTVFPADAFRAPIQNGSRLQAASASDNCAGIVALLAVATAMRAAGLQPESPILFAGNVGEEGEGNLRGMRHLLTSSPFAERVQSVVALDGAGTESIVTQALGSKRFGVTIHGPGGHSWTDAGVPNPVLALAHALSALDAIDLPASPRTTWNIGVIQGGTAINAIPQSVHAKIDTRSTEPALLRHLEQQLRDELRHAIDRANRQFAGPTSTAANPAALRLEIDVIGERPAAALPEDARILALLRATDRHLGIVSQPRIASTDANIPLSLGIEAVSIGSGGSGGGVHTMQEWFDAEGRDLALRRILLLTMALTAQPGESSFAKER